MTCLVCDDDRTARIVMVDPEFRRPWWSRIWYRGAHRRGRPGLVPLADLLTTGEVTA